MSGAHTGTEMAVACPNSAFSGKAVGKESAYGEMQKIFHT